MQNFYILILCLLLSSNAFAQFGTGPFGSGAPTLGSAGSGQWTKNRNGDIYNSNSNGNVGIGTTVVSGLLDIRNPANFLESDLFIDSLGNIGINTTVPTTKLQINGDVSLLGTHQRIGFKNTSATNNAFFIDGNDGANGALRFASVNNTNNNVIDLDLESRVGVGSFVPVSPSGYTQVNTMAWPANWEFSQLSLGGVQKGTAWDVSTSLTGFLKMEDNAASTTVVDTQGALTCTASANTSTLTTAGKLNNALSFNGTTTDINCGTTFQPTGSFSIEGWVNSAASNNRDILGNRSSSGSNIGFRLGFTSGSVFQALIDTGSASQTVTATVCSNGTACHWVLTYDGATMTLYKNGVSVGTGAITGDAGTGADSLHLGDVAQGFTSTFSGSLDNWRFWTGRVLTAAEVGYLYNSGTGTESTSGSVAGSTAGMNIVASTTWNTTHSLGGTVLPTPDLGISGKLEVDSTAFFDGNVGIGTASTGIPNKLYVVGTPMFTGGMNVGIGTATMQHTCLNNGALYVGPLCP